MEPHLDSPDLHNYQTSSFSTLSRLRLDYFFQIFSLVFTSLREFSEQFTQVSQYDKEIRSWWQDLSWQIAIAELKIKNSKSAALREPWQPSCKDMFLEVSIIWQLNWQESSSEDSGGQLDDSVLDHLFVCLAPRTIVWYCSASFYTMLSLMLFKGSG